MLQNGEYQGKYTDIDLPVIFNPFCPLDEFSHLVLCFNKHGNHWEEYFKTVHILTGF